MSWILLITSSISAYLWIIPLNNPFLKIILPSSVMKSASISISSCSSPWVACSWTCSCWYWVAASSWTSPTSSSFCCKVIAFKFSYSGFSWFCIEAIWAKAICCSEISSSLFELLLYCCNFGVWRDIGVEIWVLNGGLGFWAKVVFVCFISWEVWWTNGCLFVKVCDCLIWGLPYSWDWNLRSNWLTWAKPWYLFCGVEITWDWGLFVIVCFWIICLCNCCWSINCFCWSCSFWCCCWIKANCLWISWILFWWDWINSWDCCIAKLLLLGFICLTAFIWFWLWLGFWL